MKFTTVPSSHSMVPINIRGNASSRGIKVHKKWTDVDLLNLWDQCLYDDTLIEASLGLAPKEVLHG